MLKLIYLTLFLCFLLSCTNKTTIEEIKTYDVPLHEKIEYALNSDYLQQIGITAYLQEQLTEVYKLNGFKAFWSNDSSLTFTGEQLHEIIKSPIFYGIPNERYAFIKQMSDNFIEKEIIITSILSMLAHDLQYGFIIQDSTAFKPCKTIDANKLIELFHFNTENIDKEIISWGPSNKSYRTYAEALFNFCKKYPIDYNTFQIKPYKIDSLEAIKETELALVSKGFLFQMNNDSVYIIQQLKTYQALNSLDPDGVIGSNTSMVLNESTYHKLLRASITLEKIRWSIPRPEKYILVNLPSFSLTFWANDSILAHHRVIIGADETPTPQLISKLNRIIIYPYWTVPQSICLNEILPILKKNPSYLSKQNMKIFQKDKEVDPLTIDWKKYRGDYFPFKLRQEYGPKNSLGIIKFEFYNPYSVYIHDTPNKLLFNKDVRKMSHGCMRCENPVELARIILSSDTIESVPARFNDSIIDVYFKEKEHIQLPLKIKIPLFVEYQTVGIKENELIFYTDIYAKDSAFIVDLFKPKPIGEPVP
jgi:L,D-transpeptidase YcbB